MNFKVILIVLGEPNSTFSEILFKYFKSLNFKQNQSKFILIGSKKLIDKQIKKLKFNFNLKEIKDIKESVTRSINIINVDYKFTKKI